MKLGVVFPQTEIGTDPAVVAEFATTAEALGYDHLVVYDHILGASTANRPDWRGPYTSESLGIGTGWNAVEYEALGKNFHDRGVRSEEQIELMRHLWADEVISYDGRWHKVTDAGLNPLPTNRRIPVWLGGMAPQVIDRVGRLADGWFPHFNPNLAKQIDAVRTAAQRAGRDPDDIGIECMTTLPDVDATDRLRRLEDLGVTHTAVVTMNAGHDTPKSHIDAIKRHWETMAPFAD